MPCCLSSWERREVASTHAAAPMPESLPEAGDGARGARVGEGGRVERDHAHETPCPRAHHAHERTVSEALPDAGALLKFLGEAGDEGGAHE
eukprot:7343069-Prymnesium_polylepis.1